jgi:DsbC/DsbD-like thiol-disulfide interchange protein
MFRVLASLLLALFAAAPLSAGPGEVRLVPGWHEDGRYHVAGVEISMPPGWHTYWRVPGATGIPPRFDWSGSTNLRRASVEWPHPEVFRSFGTRTIGYHDRVLLPLLLEPEDPDAPIDLSLTLSYGVCKDICIPAEARLEGRLLPGSGDVTARAMIEPSLARRVRRAADGGVIDATCRFAMNGRSLGIAATVDLATMPAAVPATVIEAAARPDLWIGEAEARANGRRVFAEAPVEASGGTAIVDRRELRLTLIEPGLFVEVDGCRAPD